MDEMKANLERYCVDVPAGACVFDIGAMDVNGTYRALVEPRWDYMGFDLQPGPNVDVVMPSEYSTGLSDNVADIVISGQVMEHCRNPFLLAAEMIRVCKPGGWLLVVAPWRYAEHRFPVDCWRFLPDGMRELFPVAKVRCEMAYINAKDCWFVGVKL